MTEITFEKATQLAKELKVRPSNTILKELYGLYKQAIEGPNNTPKPNWAAFEQRAKWDAWNEVSHMHKDVAKQKYIDIVKSLI